MNELIKDHIKKLIELQEEFDKKSINIAIYKKIKGNKEVKWILAEMNLHKL